MIGWFGRGFYVFNCGIFWCPNCWLLFGWFFLLRDILQPSEDVVQKAGCLHNVSNENRHRSRGGCLGGEKCRGWNPTQRIPINQPGFQWKVSKVSESCFFFFFRGLCFRGPIFLDINQPSTNLPTCYLEIRPPIWPWLRETNGGLQYLHKGWQCG